MSESKHLVSEALQKLRLEINDIDKNILDLLKKRSEAVLKVGEVKNTSNTAIYIPEREKQIFEKLKTMNQSKLPDEAIIAIYTEIISACRNLEKPLAVSFLGPETSFTHSAAIKKFGSSVKFIPQSSIDAVFYNVERDYSNYGVVPIENTTEGTVNYTLDKFMDSSLNIVAEVDLKISHSFFSLEDDLKNIKKVYSHPQSFGQCKNWIMNNIPNIERVEVSSNSYAAELASKEKGVAAIGPEIAAKKYDLNILFSSVEDFEHNTTRFLIIGKNENKASGFDKTSIMFSPEEKVGTLYDALEHFKKEGVNLTMIESRPNKKEPWKYVFFIDCEGHYEDEKLNRALEQLRKNAKLKILGSYPKK